jgi:PilZ domain-containing protein
MAMVERHDERRRFSRIAFHRPAELVVGAAATTCGVLDVSLRGALVEVPAAFPAELGQACALVIRLAALDAAIELAGVVVHREGATLGVRCTGIDLESITHLRRLVELNLGDTDLLHRELGALVGRG